MILVFFWPDVHMIPVLVLLWLGYTYFTARFAPLLILFVIILCVIVMQK